jgi:hypothetical protein
VAAEATAGTDEVLAARDRRLRIAGGCRGGLEGIVAVQPDDGDDREHHGDCDGDERESHPAKRSRHRLAF